MNHRNITTLGSKLPVLSGMAIALLLPANAQDADLAQKLSNPVSDLISLPIQSNIDFGVGPGDGTRWTTNVQPVIPFSLTENWNLISRTVLPIIDVEGTQLGGTGDEFGLGDTVQSFFFSPKSSDPIWGFGPVFLLPTATDSMLGGEKWGAGSTGVVLKQSGPWTYGALANHIWDFAGDSSRGSVNATFFQPFVSYTTPEATTYGANLESSYDWHNDQWSVPLNLTVSQLMTIGDQPVQFSPAFATISKRPPEGRNGVFASALPSFSRKAESQAHSHPIHPQA